VYIDVCFINVPSSAFWIGRLDIISIVLPTDLGQKWARDLSFLLDATVYVPNLCPAITFQPNVRIANLLILRVRLCLFYQRGKGLFLNRPSWSCFNRFAARPWWRAFLLRITWWCLTFCNACLEHAITFQPDVRFYFLFHLHVCICIYFKSAKPVFVWIGRLGILLIVLPIHQKCLTATI
jgi:hypothetical protein